MSGFDTPSQHVHNGKNLLQRGKLDAARQEFARATELDPNYTPAYLGLAQVFIRMGDIDKAFEYMTLAEKFAASDKEKADVAEGFKELNDLKKQKIQK